MRIDDASHGDFDAILALNQASVHFLSTMDRERLQHLHAQAALHRVARGDGRVAAFLLAFREGSAYDSVNYRWFAQRYARFLYIDRVVVDDACRGQGLGRALYEDLFGQARAMGVPVVTCEFDIEPPNRVSARFHTAFGFREVGTQAVPPTGKRVSLQEAKV
jgi:predicted GNAT superfamily acetyltransferase